MKKLLSFILILTLVMSSAVLSYADDNSQKVNKLLSVLKDRIGTTDEFDDFSSYVNNYDGKTTYSFSWTKDGKNGDFASLNVSMTESGIITHYHLYRDSSYNYESKPTLNRSSSSEALETAKNEFARLNPDICKNIRITDSDKKQSLYNSTFSFKICRYENDIPVLNDMGYIDISSDAKELVSFNINYTEGVEFNKPDNLISYEDAIENYADKFGMKLFYGTDYKDKERSAVLEYRSKSEPNQFISAEDGSAVKFNCADTVYYSKEEAAMDSKTMSMGSSKFSEVELKELEKLERLISEDDAKKILSSNSVIAMDKNLKLTGSHLRRDWYDENKYLLTLSFESENKKYTGLNAELDASSGEILSFYKYNNTYEEKKKYTQEQAKSIVEKAVRILSPKHFNEFVISEKENDDESGYFTFTRIVNNIEYENNRIYINVNMYDGSVTDYNISYDDIAFPSPDGILSENEACKKALEQTNYNIYYVMDYGKNKSINAYAVYAFDDYSLICDAFTGELKYKYEGNTVSGEYTDIGGHYGEYAIKELVNYGIGFEGDKFLPDNKITQAEYIALLNSVFLGYEPIIMHKSIETDRIYGDAISSGIIKKEENNPDALVTRDMAAVMMVRALGYEDVANLDNIYKPMFNDVTQHIGATSILNAMHVIKGDENGNFNPNNTLTRADAAIIIYNYLSR